MTLNQGQGFLLLCSQLYLWSSPFLVRFLHMWPLSNPTIEAVTCHLHGWCMLGLFLLPAFTHLGQDFSNPCDRMQVCRLDLGLHTYPKEFWGNGVRTHVNSKGKIASTGGSDEDQIRTAASCRTASPTHYQLSYSGPRSRSIKTSITQYSSMVSIIIPSLNQIY